MSETATESQLDVPSTDRLVIRIKLVSQESAPPPTRRSSRAAQLAIAGVVVALLVGWFGIGSLESDPPPPPAVAEAPVAAAPAPKPVDPEVPQQPDAPPSAINEAIPDVPQSALDTIRGTIRVIVRVSIDKPGKVVAAAADDPGPSRYFERLSLEAAKKWTFTPAKLEDQRVMFVRFNFTRAGATANASLAPTVGMRAAASSSAYREGQSPGRLQMNPTITAFEQSPDRGQGLARDMRVRWALEEVGQPYDVRLVSFAAMKEPAHRKLHPFGQIPTYQEGDVTLFESGAIVLHIAERHGGLLPEDADARMRAIAWMFAALNTVEPPIVERSMAMILERDKSWYAERQTMLDDRVRARLGELSNHLGDAEWLDGAFSAGDLLMVTVLRRLRGSGGLEHYPNLRAYIARGEARPAYQRAFTDQLAVFTAAQAKS